MTEKQVHRGKRLLEEIESFKRFVKEMSYDQKGYSIEFRPPGCQKHYAHSITPPMIPDEMVQETMRRLTDYAKAKIAELEKELEAL